MELGYFFLFEFHLMNLNKWNKLIMEIEYYF